MWIAIVVYWNECPEYWMPCIAHLGVIHRFWVRLNPLIYCTLRWCEGRLIHALSQDIFEKKWSCRTKFDIYTLAKAYWKVKGSLCLVGSGVSWPNVPSMPSWLQCSWYNGRVAPGSDIRILPIQSLILNPNSKYFHNKHITIQGQIFFSEQHRSSKIKKKILFIPSDFGSQYACSGTKKGPYSNKLPWTDFMRHWAAPIRILGKLKLPPVLAHSNFLMVNCSMFHRSLDLRLVP